MTLLEIGERGIDVVARPPKIHESKARFLRAAGLFFFTVCRARGLDLGRKKKKREDHDSQIDTLIPFAPRGTLPPNSGARVSGVAGSV